MAKDPAILFYTSDFISGTITMTNEQRGKYILLLCLQHQKGKLTEKDMMNICGTYDEDIFLKFKKDSNGRFYNERMEIETNRRKSYSESRRKNRSGTKKKSQKDISNTSKTYDKHMENEDEDVNRNINEIEDSEDFHEKLTYAFWKLFIHNMERFGVKSTDLNKAKSKDWVNNIRKMIEIDKRSENDIAIIYGYLKEEEPDKGFAWAMNIRSTESLRKNFEKILIKAKNNKSKTQQYDRDKIFADLQQS